MLRPFSMIFFIAVMVWVGGIFITSDPRTRIDRACLPVTYADSMLVAVVQVIHEPYAMGAHQMMLAFEYGCKFTVWKMFYEKHDLDSKVEHIKAVTSQTPQPEVLHADDPTKKQSTSILKTTENKEQSPDAPATPKTFPRYLESK